jgi:hypothetical protein
VRGQSPELFARPGSTAIFLRVVEHSCQQCHSAVLDNSAFCPSCDAPQIRFSTPGPSVLPIAVAAGVESPVARVEESYPIRPAPAAWSRRAAFRAVMNAGVVAAVLSSVPVGGSFIFALPLAGFLCVLLYRRSNGGEDPTLGVGFRLGAGAGLAGFVIFMLLAAIETLGFHQQNELRAAMIQAVQQAQARYSDPQARETLTYFMTPEGLAFLMVFGSAFMGVVFVILSGVGGVVSAALLRRKLPPP